jgi:hypothetical protein
VQLADWMPRPADPEPLFGRDLLHDAQQHEGRT